jgi:enamine deaminase RidA (YjgF/YER057c/UK114 family)
VATDPSGRIVEGAGSLACENIKAMLSANGATLDDVVKVTVFITDMVGNRYSPTKGPASTIVEISKLALSGLLVEIEAIAAVA